MPNITGGACVVGEGELATGVEGSRNVDEVAVKACSLVDGPKFVASYLFL